MTDQEINKSIAYLADKVGKYHERLIAMERDVQRHVKNVDQHCNGDCDCKKSEPELIKALQT